MLIKIDEPSDIPVADLDKSYKKQNEQIIMTRFLARTPDNDIYMLEPANNKGIPKISVGSVIEFYYKTEGKPQAVKSCNAHILTGFYDIQELGVYIFGNGLDEFNEGSDMKSFIYNASGFIGPVKE